jgi:hypothetical protein
MCKKVLLVSGHLRNYYHNPSRFVDSYLSKFDVDNRLLYTHRTNGWWTGDMKKTLEEDDNSIDLGLVNPNSFFDCVSFMCLSERDSTINQYSILPLHPSRGYYREASYKAQVVNRYLLMRQVLNGGAIDADDVVVLTRPDILLKDPSMAVIIQKSISEFSRSDDELLLFDAGGIPHDCIIVGRGDALQRLFSPEVYNTNQYAQPHENLQRIGRELFKTRTVIVNESFYYANSPNMKQYGA